MPVDRIRLERHNGADSASIPRPKRVNGAAALRKSKRDPQIKLLSRDEIDGRLHIAKRWDALVGSISADLGGSDQLTAIERRLIEAFAGASLALDNLNACALLGQKIDIAELAQIGSTLVRIGSRLGIQRRPRDATPSLSEYLAIRVRDDADADTEGTE